jgi:hypothetical protein
MRRCRSQHLGNKLQSVEAYAHLPTYLVGLLAQLVLAPLPAKPATEQGAAGGSVSACLAAVTVLELQQQNSKL